MNIVFLEEMGFQPSQELSMREIQENVVRVGLRWWCRLM
jgi:hypothetical protein